MAVMENLIWAQENGSIGFGNHKLSAKSKQDNFEHEGDVYKVKTFGEITKLERNGSFVYESVPGTTVFDLQTAENQLTFRVEGAEDAQITLGLENETEYRVFVEDVNVGCMRTNLGGKLNLSVELNEGTPVSVRVEKAPCK